MDKDFDKDSEEFHRDLLDREDEIMEFILGLDEEE